MAMKMEMDMDMEMDLETKPKKATERRTGRKYTLLSVHGRDYPQTVADTEPCGIICLFAMVAAVAVCYCSCRCCVVSHLAILAILSAPLAVYLCVRVLLHGT